MAREISNSDDVVDSRDVIARIEELDDEREALVEAATETAEALAALEGDDREGERDEATEARDAAKDALASWDEDVDTGGELKALKALAAEAEGYCPDWEHGETLIRESHFKDYAQELAEDCGMIKTDVSGQWPYTCIDWDQAARELKMDYTELEYDGVAYLARCG